MDLLTTHYFFGPFGCFFIDAQRTGQLVRCVIQTEGKRHQRGRLVCTASRTQSRSQSLVFGLSTFELLHSIDLGFFFFFSLSFLSFSFQQLPELGFLRQVFERKKSLLSLEKAPLCAITCKSTFGQIGRRQVHSFYSSPISFFLRVICDTTLNFLAIFSISKVFSFTLLVGRTVSQILFALCIFFDPLHL